MGGAPAKSVCVFCGSYDAARPEYIQAATALGRALATAHLKLVYGGGGVGLMGATAKAAHAAGGQVLGIIPTFLIGKERALETVEHVVVANMHERKAKMTDLADAFLALPYFDGLHRFLPALVKREGYDVGYVDVIDRPRRHGQSHYGLWNRLWIGLLDLSGVWWMIRRCRATKITEVTFDAG